MREKGFNIVELMVVLLIVGIVGVFAFPAMTSMLATQAVRSAAYDLLADLTYARSEAIGRGTDVIVSGNSGTDWKLGWTIRETAGGTVLRVQEARTSGAITLTGGLQAITFDRTGRSNAGVLGWFSVVPTAASAQVWQKRCVRLDPSGRVRSAEGACA